MPYVGLCTVAMNARSIATNDADVVEHGGSLQKLPVNIPLRMIIRYLESTVSHLPAMSEQQSAQLVVLWIIIMYNV